MKKKDRKNTKMGIGFGEAFVITGIAAAYIGPKGMPKFAREAGRMSGSAVRMIKQGREAVTEFNQQNNIHELHKELQEGLDEVTRVRNEWRSLTRPSSVTKALLQPPPTSTHTIQHDSGPAHLQTPPLSETLLSDSQPLQFSETLRNSSQGGNGHIGGASLIAETMEILRQSPTR
eukprot:m.264613 g.264613  ORF g.264613 m.264613 type:complete len:175 (-) comp16232_c0_seq28:150-674(-)